MAELKMKPIQVTFGDVVLEGIKELTVQFKDDVIDPMIDSFTQLTKSWTSISWSIQMSFVEWQRLLMAVMAGYPPIDWVVDNLDIARSDVKAITETEVQLFNGRRIPHHQTWITPWYWK